ncbi:MAG TPA: endonuclease/exonuclease/phosphatase family protein [Pyrinomonadaceae bacterium]|nr:endonuclease/exonuclease/phosphatase family protein [Pyrinomonadaceae bacterium]
MRIVTYNVHKCRGLDRRVRPARIASVLRELDADIIALQEVLSVGGGAREMDQARFIAEELGYDYCIGENRRLGGGAYGNVILSRLPWRHVHNYDITWRGRERRGCLRVDIETGGAGGAATEGAGGAAEGAGRLLHLLNVHLGTAYIERRHQARQLVGDRILGSAELTGARVVLGDFNEWTKGLATRLLTEQLQSADLRTHLRSPRTYPGALPLVHLDHIYFDPALELQQLTLHKSLTALVASDHLPLVADFRVRA